MSLPRFSRTPELTRHRFPVGGDEHDAGEHEPMITAASTECAGPTASGIHRARTALAGSIEPNSGRDERTVQALRDGGASGRNGTPDAPPRMPIKRNHR